jgi:Protein of unknown function (DUF3987)
LRAHDLYAAAVAATPSMQVGYATEPEPWGEPETSLLATRRMPAPRLPLDVFGPFWGDWIAASGEEKGAPADYIAAGLLSAASVLLGNSRWGSPWPGWKEPPVLWSALVGNPSSGKSPALDAVGELLRRLEVERNADLDERRRLHEADKQSAKERRVLWEQRVKAAVKDGGVAPPLPADAEVTDLPQRRRLMTTDPTTEKLVRLVAENPRGLILMRDELAGWIGGMDRYNGAGSDRACWLEAYGGRPFFPDRVKDTTPIQVPHLTVAITGGIQPDRLANMVLRGDDDGLAARFLYVFPEPLRPERPGRHADHETAMAAFRRLLTLEMVIAEMPKPLVLKMDSAAATVLQEWREEAADLEDGAAGLFLSWLGKLSGLAVRLALVVEHLWWAGEHAHRRPPEAISERATTAAVALLADYAMPMARRTFGEASLPKPERDAAVIARWIKTQCPLPEVINAREIQRRRLPGLTMAQDVRAALEELHEAGWVRPVPHPSGVAHRPRSDWEVNPRVREVLR